MANKFSVVVIFGEGAAKGYMYDGLKGLQERISEGALIKRQFDTQAEMDAYIKGIDDADGWLGSAIIDDEDIKKHPRIIKKLLEY